MGVFTRQLTLWGFSAGNAVFIRGLGAAVLLGITMLFKDRASFKINPRHIWCFLGTGVCSQMLFSTAYTMTLELTSFAVAAILLYTAPAFVMIMSIILFGEKFTRRKLVALVLAFSGCCLVSGITEGELNITTTGLALGLFAGFGYALYSIFARYAFLRGYGNMTINFYTSLFSTISAGIIFGFANPLTLATSSLEIFGFCILFALVLYYIPYLFYTYGLSNTENSKASIMASIEPVVATLLGVVIYKEELSFVCICGVTLVMLAIITLNTGKVTQ